MYYRWKLWSIFGGFFVGEIGCSRSVLIVLALGGKFLGVFGRFCVGILDVFLLVFIRCGECDDLFVRFTLFRL